MSYQDQAERLFAALGRAVDGALDDDEALNVLALAKAAHGIMISAILLVPDSPERDTLVEKIADDLPACIATHPAPRILGTTEAGGLKVIWCMQGTASVQ